MDSRFNIDASKMQCGCNLDAFTFDAIKIQFT